jgi:peptide methionine sulfoxide reductase MsrB
MPDIQNFSLVAQVDASVSVARITVSGQICNSHTGAVLSDFTGPNAITFALRVAGFTVQQHRELAQVITQKILRMSAGLE